MSAPGCREIYQYFYTFSWAEEQNAPFLIAEMPEDFSPAQRKVPILSSAVTFFLAGVESTPKGTDWYPGTSLVVMTGGAGVLFHSTPGPGGPTGLLLTGPLTDTCSLATVPRGHPALRDALIVGCGSSPDGKHPTSAFNFLHKWFKNCMNP